jgi:hypothetical protein
MTIEMVDNTISKNKSLKLTNKNKLKLEFKDDIKNIDIAENGYIE